MNQATQNLQTLLSQFGYYKGPINGEMDTATEVAYQLAMKSMTFTDINTHQPNPMGMQLMSFHSQAVSASAQMSASGHAGGGGGRESSGGPGAMPSVSAFFSSTTGKIAAVGAGILALGMLKKRRRK